MTFANTVFKGNKDIVEKIVAFLNENDSEYGLEDEIEVEFNEKTGLATAYAPINTDDYEELIAEILLPVKWMAFVEVWGCRSKIDLIASDYNSSQIDLSDLVCYYDFENDDRLSIAYYPDDSFVHEFLWSSAGEWETVDYSCPFADWWNEE